MAFVATSIENTRFSFISCRVVLLWIGVVSLCASGCTSERDLSQLRSYGAGYVWGDVPWRYKYIIFDPAIRVINDDDFAAVVPTLKRAYAYELIVDNQQISDRSIGLINQLKRFESFHLSGTNVTAAGLHRLQLPKGTKIYVSVSR